MVSVPLWKTIDRFSLRAAVLAACGQSEGSVVVIRGSKDCDLATVADYMFGVLGEVGVRVCRITPAGDKPTVVRDLLASAWRHVDAPAAMGAVRRSVSEAKHLSGPDLIREVAACCAASSTRTAFVFGVVDPEGPLSRTQMSLFADLAYETGATVIVCSQAESLSKFPRGVNIVDLANMQLWEIRSQLNTSPEFASYDSAEVAALLAELTALSTDTTTVCPADVYDVVQQRLRRWDGP